MSVDEAFDNLAQKVIEDAGRVRCDSAAYRDGLRHIIEELQTAITASAEMDGDDSDRC